MGLLSPPKRTQKVIPDKPAKGHFFFAGKEFARVPWWKRPNMRVLYFYIVILILTNTANGFDGKLHHVTTSLTQVANIFRLHDERSSDPLLLARVLQPPTRFHPRPIQCLYESWLSYWPFCGALSGRLGWPQGWCSDWLYSHASRCWSSGWSSELWNVCCGTYNSGFW